MPVSGMDTERGPPVLARTREEVPGAGAPVRDQSDGAERHAPTGCRRDIYPVAGSNTWPAPSREAAAACEPLDYLQPCNYTIMVMRLGRGGVRTRDRGRRKVGMDNRSVGSLGATLRSVTGELEPSGRVTEIRPSDTAGLHAVGPAVGGDGGSGADPLAYRVAVPCSGRRAGCRSPSPPSNPAWWWRSSAANDASGPVREGRSALLRAWLERSRLRSLPRGKTIGRSILFPPGQIVAFRGTVWPGR